MSKETSSTLLRFGINNFWSNSISSPRSLYSPMQFNSYFYYFFKNYFFIPLKIQYQKNKIIIYIFYFKNEKYNFIKKYFVWKNLKLSKLIYRKKYNFLSLTKTYKKNKKKLINNKIFSLLEKLFIIKNFYWTIKRNKQLPLLLMIKKYKTIRNFSNFVSKRKLKLKKINFILKIKKLSIMCEIILNSYLYNSYKIIIKTTFKNLLYNRFPFFFKYLKYNNLKKNIYLLLTGFIFNKSTLINIYITNLIKNTKNKKHIKNLIGFFNIMKSLFEKQFISFNGYKFFMSGRLNGKLRKSSFGFKLGSLKLLSFSTNVNYSCDIIHTQYGCFSVKSWLCLKSND